ncbi:MAG: hypothetical protein AAF984_04775 [Verrucomicrobiota bacterium]
MLGVFFPTDFEAKEFVAHLEKIKRHDVNETPVYKGIFNNKELIVGIIGIGHALSEKNARLIMSRHPLHMVILAGFAGGLNENLHKGNVVVANGYTLPETLAYLKMIPDFDIADMCTVKEVVGTAEDKAELRKKSGCHLVDMETEGVAKVVNDFNVDFLAVRVISDTADENLPVNALKHSYDYKKGRPNPLGLIIHCLFHPLDIMPLKKFIGSLPPIRTKLTQFLLAVCKEMI